MTEAQTALAAYVNTLVRCSMMQQAPGELPPPVSLSTSLSDVVRSYNLAHKYIPFEHINRTHKYKGKLGFCYQEAFKLAERDPLYIYCEGYATTEQVLIPLEHAWCVHRETKEVYDPVWNSRKARGNAYYGLPLNFAFVIDVVMHNKQYGVLDSLWMCRSLLNIPFGDLIHPDYRSIII